MGEGGPLWMFVCSFCGQRRVMFVLFVDLCLFFLWTASCDVCAFCGQRSWCVHRVLLCDVCEGVLCDLCFLIALCDVGAFRGSL